MIFSLGQLKTMESVLQKINEASCMDIRTAFQFSKFLKLVASELATMEEQRIKLVERFGVPMDDGSIKVADMHTADFLREYNTLAETTVTIPFAHLELSKLEGIGLSPNDLILIGMLIKEDHE